MKISYSAPAKVILSGEHAVVYGKLALVSAINLRLKFSITILGRPSQDSKSSEVINFISQKVKDYLKNYKINFVDKHFIYEIESEIPIGRGLGSSAALSVASVATFLEFYTGRQFEKETVNDLAFQIEKYFHKNPSGVDNSAACFGGLILYQKQKSLKNLDYKIPKEIEEKLFLIDSGIPTETTGEMVDYVRTQNTTVIFNKIEIVTDKFQQAIEKKSVNIFNQCLLENEKLLEDLGVVSEKTKKLLKKLSKFGVGKITGAGGRETNSGFILFFAENIEQLIKYLKARKIVFYKFMPDNKGLVRI